MTEYVIRSATVADVDTVAEIHVRSWRREHRGLVPDDMLAEADARVWARLRRARIADSAPLVDWLVAVAPTDQHIMGMADVGPYRREKSWADVDDGCGEVYAIYVDPQRWGCGVGRALLGAAIDRLAANGMRDVMLWVLTANRRAQRFYARYGFVADGVTRTTAVGNGGCGAVELQQQRLTFRVASTALHRPGKGARA